MVSPEYSRKRRVVDENIRSAADVVVAGVGWGTRRNGCVHIGTNLCDPDEEGRIRRPFPGKFWFRILIYRQV